MPVRHSGTARHPRGQWPLDLASLVPLLLSIASIEQTQCQPSLTGTPNPAVQKSDCRASHPQLADLR